MTGETLSPHAHAPVAIPVHPRRVPLEDSEIQARAFADPDLWLYRERTMAMLKRYMRLSVEVGRLPSLLGREFFRTRITAYNVMSFEDTVIFVHDVERSLEKLDEYDQEMIARVVFLEYSQDEVAGRMRCWRRTVGRRFPETLDHVSEIFLASGLLTRLPGHILESGKSCQEGKIEEISASDSEQSKYKIVNNVPSPP